MARVLQVFFSVCVLFEAAWGSAIRADESARANVGIIGGQNVSISENPSAVSILFKDSTGKLMRVCGGSIVDASHILTSVICVNDPLATNLTIRFGSTYLSSGGADAVVEKVIKHENFSDKTLANNIALLKLESPIIFGWLAKANLPTQEFKLTVGTNANFTGWGGDDAAIDVPYTEVLHEVTLEIRPGDACKNTYTPVIDATLICAGSPKAKLIQGDGGGPLIQNGVLIGVESFDSGNGPFIFTNVISYLDWIKSKISGK